MPAPRPERRLQEDPVFARVPLVAAEDRELDRHAKRFPALHAPGTTEVVLLPGGLAVQGAQPPRWVCRALTELAEALLAAGGADQESVRCGLMRRARRP